MMQWLSRGFLVLAYLSALAVANEQTFIEVISSSGNRGYYKCLQVEWCYGDKKQRLD